jgi:glycosyltransferase involved in cell wall biosynthesis
MADDLQVMEIRHIYWFSYFGATLPSVRYRATHPLRHLWAWHGVGSTFVEPGYSPLKLWAFLRAWSEALFLPRPGAVIVVQRLFTFGPYALALRLLIFFRGDRCIYDIDDAEYMERPAGTIHAFMRNCALVTAGSLGLLDHAKRYNPNGLLLTSPVPDHGQRKAEPGRSATRNPVFTIGWVGCFWGTHEANLHKLLLPALHDLGFRVKLLVLGARDGEAEARTRALFADDRWLTIEVPTDIDWNDEQAVHARIARFDVGVSPLMDTEINRCKSAFKLKQYLSCGVPVLASPVGENTRFLREGENGFACRSAADFRQGLYRVAGITDEDYARLSSNALRSVTAFDQEHYALAFLAGCRALKAFRTAGDRLRGWDAQRSLAERSA